MDGNSLEVKFSWEASANIHHMLIFLSRELDICLSLGSSISISVYYSTLYEYLNTPQHPIRKALLLSFRIEEIKIQWK